MCSSQMTPLNATAVTGCYDSIDLCPYLAKSRKLCTAPEAAWWMIHLCAASCKVGCGANPAVACGWATGQWDVSCRRDVGAAPSCFPRRPRNLSDYPHLSLSLYTSPPCSPGQIRLYSTQPPLRIELFRQTPCSPGQIRLYSTQPPLLSELFRQTTCHFNSKPSTSHDTGKACFVLEMTKL